MLPNVKVRSHCIKGGVNLFTVNFIKNIINFPKFHSNPCKNFVH